MAGRAKIVGILGKDSQPGFLAGLVVACKYSQRRSILHSRAMVRMTRSTRDMLPSLEAESYFPTLGLVAVGKESRLERCMAITTIRVVNALGVRVAMPAGFPLFHDLDLMRVVMTTCTTIGLRRVIRLDGRRRQNHQRC